MSLAIAIPELEILCSNDIVHPNDQLLIRIPDYDDGHPYDYDIDDEEISLTLVNKGNGPFYFVSEYPALSDPKIIPDISRYSDSNSQPSSSSTLPTVLMPSEKITLIMKCGTFGTTFVDFHTRDPHSVDFTFRIFVSVLDPQHFRGVYPPSRDAVVYIARHTESATPTPTPTPNDAQPAAKQVPNRPIKDKSIAKEHLQFGASIETGTNKGDFFSSHFNVRTPASLYGNEGAPFKAAALSDSGHKFESSVPPSPSTTTSYLETKLTSSDVILLSVLVPVVGISLIVIVIFIVVTIMRNRYARVMRMTPSELDEALNLHNLQL